MPNGIHQARSLVKIVRPAIRAVPPAGTPQESDRPENLPEQTDQHDRPVSHRVGRRDPVSDSVHPTIIPMHWHKHG